MKHKTLKTLDKTFDSSSEEAVGQWRNWSDSKPSEVFLLTLVSFGSWPGRMKKLAKQCDKVVMTWESTRQKSYSRKPECSGKCTCIMQSVLRSELTRTGLAIRNEKE